MAKLTKYLNNNPGFGTYLETCERPIQAIHRVNPELASIIHYDAEKGLNPQMIPLLRDFRRAERDEKIATIQAIERMYATDANERMHEGELVTAKELARMGYGSKKYEIDSTERMHGKDMDVESERVASAERRDGYGTDADVYKHRLSTAAGIEETRERTKQLEISVQATRDIVKRRSQALESTVRTRESNKTRRTEIQEASAVEQARINAKVRIYESDSKERMHKASLKTSRYFAESEERRMGLEINLGRSKIASDERREMASINANRELNERRQRTLERTIEDQFVTKLVKLATEREETEKRKEVQETTAAYEALAKVSEVLKNGDIKEIEIESDGKKYTLKVKK